MEKPKQDKGHSANVPPDKVKLTRIQAHRLSQLTHVDIKKIEGRDIAQLSESLKWQIDPADFLFRRICGQVVRWDPVSGQYQPVPFATVHVMDTECDFLGYFPLSLPWVWLYPLFCDEEEITSVLTDECGRFCVWIPSFDIDWVVRWRLERYCFPEIFVQPNLGEVLQSLGIIPTPGPGPDPGPIALRNAGLTVDRLASVAGRDTASKLLLAEQTAAIGGDASVLKTLLNQPGFSVRVPPPISPKLRELHKRQHGRGTAGLAEFVRGQADRKYELNLNQSVGPFLRWKCAWMIEEELVPMLEVPDITFWVTQDTDGDGDQETIYANGYFQVGWQSGPLSDVTLHASAIARINPSCRVPPVGDCEEPTILFAGLMPARAPYIDMTTGLGVRPNPPHTDAVIRPSVFPPSLSPYTPATAPFTGTIQLYGCNQYPNGEYYRLLYSFNGAPAVPSTNLAWYVDPFPGPGIPLHVVPDAQGWYPILATPDAWFPPNELLDWATTRFPDGLYGITMEIGDASKSVIFTTPTTIPFLVDNSAPSPQFLSLAWRVAGASAWNYFPDLICPIVYRPTGSNIEFRVQYQASMPHLLKVTLAGSGCGGGAIQTEMAPTWSDPPTPAFVAGVSQDPYNHWHTDPSDNFVSRAAIFSLPHDALQGCYGFSVNSYGRAFNPSGGDPADPQAHDWYYDAAWLNWSQANLSVAVVNV